MSASVVALTAVGRELLLQPPTDLDADSVREVRVADGAPLEGRGDGCV